MLGVIQQELQALKNDNQTLHADNQTLHSELESLKGDRASGGPPPGSQLPKKSGTLSARPDPVQVTVNPVTPVPLATPERFTGDNAKFSSFMTQCKLHFLCRPYAFPDDSAKVAFTISYLSGNAAQWAVPMVENDDPILYSFSNFQHEMRKMFAKHSCVQAADSEILSLRQGSKDLLSYLSDFKRLVVETSWPREKRGSLFYKGLNEELKDALSQIVDPPEDWEQLIDLVVKIDRRLGDRKGERAKGGRFLFIKPFEKKNQNKPHADKSTFENPEPMQIGGIRGPLTKEEKERRRQLNLCLYCGKPGHFAKDCSAKPKVKRVALTTTALETESSDQEN